MDIKTKALFSKLIRRRTVLNVNAAVPFKDLLVQAVLY